MKFSHLTKPKRYQVPKVPGTFWVSVLILSLGYSVPLHAYVDHIAAPWEEVWKAGEEALKPYGIQKSNRQKGVMESKWIQGQVRREKRLLNLSLKKDYWRRYRLKISLKKMAYSTQVQITGTYQFRAVDAPWHAVWQKLKLKGEDREREHDFFFKILAKLEQNKNGLAAAG